MGHVDDVIRVAKEEIGYREGRGNYTKFPPAVPSLNWAQNQPWCHTFVSWVFQKAGLRNIAPVTASCLAGVAWFKANGQFSQTPKRGSIVYYGNQGGTHVEIVVSVSRDTIRTIGGNTSGSLDGVFYNGDGVYSKSVNRNESRIYGYGHPNYPEDETPSAGKAPKFAGKNLSVGSKGPAVKAWQQRMSDRGWDIEVDGVFGSGTQNIAEQFQLEKDLEVDGIVGIETWNAAWTEPVT